MRWESTIAVGPPVTRLPPHPSRRAVFPHWALQAYARPRSSLGPPHGPSRKRTPDEVRALHPALVPQVLKPGSRRAPPLTAAMEPWAQEPPRTGEALLQTGSVPVDAIVVVVPAPLGVQLPAPVFPPVATLLLAPVGHPLARVSPLLARRPAREVGLTGSVGPPATRNAQTVDADVAGHLRPGERDHPRLVRRPLQPERAQPWAHFLVEPLRVGLRRTRAHTIIRVTPQARLAPTAGLDPLVTPPVQRIGPIHMRQDGCETTRPAVSRSLEAGPVHRSPAPRLEPLPDQPQARAVCPARCQPPPPPALLDGVEAPRDVGFYHHVRPPTWTRHGQPIHGVPRSHRWPVPLATTQAILRREGWPSPRDGAWPPLLRGVGGPSGGRDRRPGLPARTDEGLPRAWRFASHRPRSWWTPADPRAPHR
jgi:hypothetical protein